MPQMAPIWWFSLFSMFILTFIIFMMITYFFNIYKMNPTSKNKTIMVKNTNWVW